MNMKRYIIGVMAFLLSLSVAAQITYTKADSLTICRLLKEAPANASTLWFARQFHGRPYVAHTLEVNDSEQLVVNTRELDCTTLVETVTALTLCVKQEKRQWTDYLQTLRTLRYRQGVLNGYPSRLHYFTDWILDKEQMGLVSEIQQPNPPFTAVQHIKVGFMSQHPEYYKALKANPSLVKEIRQQEKALTGKTFRYIPKQEVKNTRLMRQTVKDGDILAITCKKKGLEIAHLGFAVWQKDGLHLLNASQLHHKVVTEPIPLRQYLGKHKTHTGIRVIRIKYSNSK